MKCAGKGRILMLMVDRIQRPCVVLMMRMIVQYIQIMCLPTWVFCTADWWWLLIDILTNISHCCSLITLQQLTSLKLIKYFWHFTATIFSQVDNRIYFDHKNLWQRVSKCEHSHTIFSIIQWVTSTPVTDVLTILSSLLTIVISSVTSHLNLIEYSMIWSKKKFYFEGKKCM